VLLLLYEPEEVFVIILSAAGGLTMLVAMAAMLTVARGS